MAEPALTSANDTATDLTQSKVDILLFMYAVSAHWNTDVTIGKTHFCSPIMWLRIFHACMK